MSGVAIVRALLAAHAPLLALGIPSTRIIAGTLPQGTTLPAISVTTITESEQGTVARRLGTKMIRERVQVTVLMNQTGGTTEYAAFKNLVKATSLGAGVYTGIVVGFRVRSVMPWGVGPELPQDDDRILEQSRDFMVTFMEAN